MSRFVKYCLYLNHYVFALVAHRARRRVTPAGWMALAAALFIGAMGADTNVSLGYQAFSLIGFTIALAAVCAPFGRPRVAVERILPKFGSVGQRLTYRLMVHNLTSRRQAALCFFEDLPDPRPTFEQYENVVDPREHKRSWLDRRYGYKRWRWLFHRNIRARLETTAAPVIPAAGDVSFGAALTPLRRGVLRLEGVTVGCPDPFGLFRSLRTMSLPQSILVLPRRHPAPTFQLPGAIKYQQGGVSLASSVGESEEFVALREYRAGDSVRRLHWKSFAKLGKPIVKEFQDEYFVRHALVLDTFGREQEAELFEEAVSAAASLACAIEDQESLLDLMFVGPEAYCFTTGRGVGRMEKMLEILASVQWCEEKKFPDLQQLVLEHSVQISGCVCVLLGWDERRQSLVRSLLASGTPTEVFVVLASDRELAPGVMAAHPERFHILVAGRIGERLAAL